MSTQTKTTKNEKSKVVEMPSLNTVHCFPADRVPPLATNTLRIGERCQERKARESLEASIAESQEPKIDAIAPEDGKQSIRSTVPPRDMNSSKLLDGEKTQAKEGTGSGLPWGNVEIVNVSIVRRSMG